MVKASQRAYLRSVWCDQRCSGAIIASSQGEYLCPAVVKTTDMSLREKCSESLFFSLLPPSLPFFLSSFFSLFSLSLLLPLSRGDFHEV